MTDHQRFFNLTQHASGQEMIHQAYARLSDQDFSETMVWREEVMARVKKNLARRSLTKLPEGMSPGRWNRRGTVVEQKSGRTYIVEVGGRRFTRNRRFLRPCLTQDDPEVEFTDVGADATSEDIGPDPKPEPEPFVPRRSKRQGKGRAKESDFIYY